MSRASLTQMKRLLEEQHGNLKYDISEAKSKIVGMESELLRVEIAIEDITQELSEKGDD